MIKVIYEDEAIVPDFPAVYTEVDFPDHMSWTALAQGFISSLPRYGYFVDAKTMDDINNAIEAAAEEQLDRHNPKDYSALSEWLHSESLGDK